MYIDGDISSLKWRRQAKFLLLIAAFWLNNQKKVIFGEKAVFAYFSKEIQINCR